MEQSTVERAVAEVVAKARAAWGDDLESAVLFGSAAENRLRETSDVNLLLVLRSFDARKAPSLAGTLRGARAAIRLDPMLVLKSELPDVVLAFAVKFADIAKRRRVLFGPDPFAHLTVDRAALLRRLVQVLTNAILRLRRGVAIDADDPEALAALIAASAAPLRSAAGSLRDLRGEPPVAPHEALETVARVADPARADALFATLADARARRPLPREAALATAVGLMDLASAMRESARTLETPP
jgi:predicted nucleotidyltransferase